MLISQILSLSLQQEQIYSPFILKYFSTSIPMSIRELCYLLTICHQAYIIILAYVIQLNNCEFNLSINKGTSSKSA